MHLRIGRLLLPLIKLPPDFMATPPRAGTSATPAGDVDTDDTPIASATPMDASFPDSKTTNLPEDVKEQEMQHVEKE